MKKLIFLLCFLALGARGVNSPRPSSFGIVEGNMVIRWSNLNTNHPWLISTRDSLFNTWTWETNKIWPDANGSLVYSDIIHPGHNSKFYRLWPANP